MKEPFFVLATLILACSGEALDVGSDAGGPHRANTGGTGGNGAGANTASTPLPDWSEIGACPTTGVPQPQLVGTWQGAIEDFYLQPLLPLRLVVAQATTDGVCGALTWGDGLAPPLPLVDPAETGETYGIGGGTGTTLQDGTGYRIVNGAARDDVFRFAISAYELWQDYCELQNELFYSPNAGSWQCVDDYTTGAINDTASTCTLSTGSGPVTYPLKRCAACAFGQACVCNASACTAVSTATHDFDLTLRSTQDGVFLESAPSTGTQGIWLQRVE